jgi:hypothetical protein
MIYLAQLEVRTFVSHVAIQLEKYTGPIKPQKMSDYTFLYPEGLEVAELCSVLKTLPTFTELRYSSLEEVPELVLQLWIRIWEDDKKFWESLKQEEQPLPGFPNLHLKTAEFRRTGGSPTTMGIRKDYTPHELRRALEITQNWRSFSMQHQLGEILSFLDDDMLKQAFDCFNTLT